MQINDAWIVLTVAPLSPLLVLVPFFLRFRSHRKLRSVAQPIIRSHPAHATPFRPYRLGVARMVAIEHADCLSSQCGAKASAASVLIAAGLI
ncbi:hypothetical protein [Nocardia farcinica]|uniref:hypothetical protein n=1 Tax=Nocardia farcinica TaxID=37329 RepID=UPI002453BC4E|nr:hypothetical protein [Nocardia farcinica]